MPQKIKLEDGSEQEVFTQAELEEQSTAKATEAAQKAREEAETAAQVKLDELSAELAKEQAKEKNFKALRESKGIPEEVTKSIEDLKTEIASIKNQPVVTAKDMFVNANFLPEDKDDREKFDYYYKRLSQGAVSPAEHQKAMVEALSLVAPGQKANADTRMYGTRVSSDFRQPQGEKESDASREFASALGISQEDKKKYGKKK